jgi:glutamine---fructose-6-phosphate transaminase (isomerizing)
VTSQTFAYDEQLAAIPWTLTELIAVPNYPALDADRPILFTGIGTSLHAARVATEWISQLTLGSVRPLAVDAHEVGSGHTPLTSRDQVVVISHRGYKTYPRAALRRAHLYGSATIAVVGRDAPEQPADVTVRTCPNETAGTFSVSYLATLVALARIVTATFRPEGRALAAALPGLPDAVASTLAMAPDTEWVGALSRHTPILISGFGPDLVTAQEAALKIKEGAWLWTEATSPEFALHGTPASYHSEMSAIVLVPEHDDGGRSALLADTLSRLGVSTVATCGVDGTFTDLRFAAPPHPLLRPLLAILPFHLLTAELARLRGTDPDTLHGEREPWKHVMTGLCL